MSRFYVPTSNIGERYITIDGEEAHHVIDVMRLKDGDAVVVFDGTGDEYTGFIAKIDTRDRKVTVEIVRSDKRSFSSAADITLAQAIPKKGKMDHIVEKATELGVNRIIPMVTERTIVRPDSTGAGKKSSRWRRIALEAAKQCGRTSLPAVDDVTSYKDVVARADEYDLCLFACLSEHVVPLKASLAGFKGGKMIVFIGPEGDFTPEETSLIADKGNCRLVSLGKRVLKSDTAGLFVLSVLDYEFSR